MEIVTLFIGLGAGFISGAGAVMILIRDWHER